VLLVGPSFALLFALQSRQLLSAAEHPALPAPGPASPAQQPHPATRAVALGMIAVAAVIRRLRHR
jgi:hypothetical protein